VTGTDTGDVTVYISLNEFLAIAARLLVTDVAAVRHQADLGLADSALHAPQAGFGDTEFYPTLVEKAAVLCRHIAKNHPLPDGNKRAAFTSMVAFPRRNGASWQIPDEDDAVEVVNAVAAGEMTVEALTTWVTAHTLLPG
jgi:death on curing protein